MKKILMICYPFPPNASAGAVRSERIARYLAWQGWDVDVVTIRQREDLYHETTQLEKLPRNVRVHLTKGVDPYLWLQKREPASRLGQTAKSVLMEATGFPDHTLYWNYVAVAKGLEIHRKSPVDLIYTTSPPHATQLCGLALSKIIDKPWIADFRDPWTLNAYRTGGALRTIFNQIEKFLEKRVLKGTDLILANTKANRYNMLRAFPFLSDEKVHYLPNGWEAFPGHLKPGKKPSEFTIVHAGHFYPRFKPYALLHALAIWRRGADKMSLPPFHGGLKVLLLGAGDDATVRLVEELELTDIVEIRPWVALDEAREIMMAADFLWTSLGTDAKSRTYIPSKIFEYISSGRPILGFFPEGEAENLIRRTKTGKVFTCDDPLPIIDFLNDCLNKHKQGEPVEYRPVEGELAALEIKNLISQLHHIMRGLVRTAQY